MTDVEARVARPTAPQRRLGRREMLLAAGVGVAVDVALRAGGIGMAETAVVAVMAAGLLTTGTLRQRQSQLVVATAVVFAGWLTVRTSPWLVAPDLLAVGLLLVVGVSVARDGDLSDCTWPRLVLRTAWASAIVATGVAHLARALTPREGATATRRAVARVGTGLVLAMPVTALVAVLLASADPVFAHFLRLPVEPDDAMSHATMVAVGACIAAGLLVATTRPANVTALPPHRRLLGVTEATVVLGALVAVFALFAVAQLVAMSDAGRRVIETSGLTYAEYARSGYFQLLAVAAFTMTVLLSLRAAAVRGSAAASRWMTALGQTATALTLLILVVALRRLDLYEDAFGLTMLRLYSEVFAWWLGVTFALLAVALTSWGAQRGWLPLATAAAGLVGLLVLNVVNPEALVVRHNIEHFESTGRFDAVYLATLSDDAMPSLIAALDELPPAERAVVVAEVCRREPPSSGPVSLNVSRTRARHHLTRVCNLRQ